MKKQDDEGIRTYGTVAIRQKGMCPGSAGQSGDTQGLSGVAEAGSESVEELVRGRPILRGRGDQRRGRCTRSRRSWSSHERSLRGRCAFPIPGKRLGRLSSGVRPWPYPAIWPYIVTTWRAPRARCLPVWALGWWIPPSDVRCFSCSQEDWSMS